MLVLFVNVTFLYTVAKLRSDEYFGMVLYTLKNKGSIGLLSGFPRRVTPGAPLRVPTGTLPQLSYFISSVCMDPCIIKKVGLGAHTGLDHSTQGSNSYILYK